MKNIFLDKNTTIAIIGFGRFGKLLVSILLKCSQAKIMIISSKKIDIYNKNLTLGRSINEIKFADIIIPCVPISNFKSVIKKISPLMKNGAIVMDVCSVKMFPVDVMKTYLRNSSQIIASHPMFGPDSYRVKGKLNDLKVVLWNINAKDEVYLQTKKFFESLGLNVVELPPKDHDKFMALSLGYSYLIGKISQELGIKKTPIDTYDFQLLLNHVSIIKSDSEQLFFDMETKNPFAKDMQAKVAKTLSNILNKINHIKR